MKMLSEGAEAKVYETKVFGKQALVKRREAKGYRIRELDESLRRTRTRKEARAMFRAMEAGVSVPALLGLGEFSIYMERLPGRLMKDTKIMGKIYPEIGIMLAKMHNSNIAHGDFTPANIMISGSVPYVIDFGLADITKSDEEKALDLLLMKRSIDKKNYSVLERAYSKNCKDARRIIRRLADVEKRGRYQIRTLA